MLAKKLSEDFPEIFMNAALGRLLVRPITYMAPTYLPPTSWYLPARHLTTVHQPPWERPEEVLCRLLPCGVRRWCAAQALCLSFWCIALTLCAPLGHPSVTCLPALCASWPPSCCPVTTWILCLWCTPLTPCASGTPHVTLMCPWYTPAPCACQLASILSTNNLDPSQSAEVDASMAAFLAIGARTGGTSPSTSNVGFTPGAPKHLPPHVIRTRCMGTPVGTSGCTTGTPMWGALAQPRSSCRCWPLYSCRSLPLCCPVPSPGPPSPAVAVRAKKYSQTFLATEELLRSDFRSTTWGQVGWVPGRLAAC